MFLGDGDEVGELFGRNGAQAMRGDAGGAEGLAFCVERGEGFQGGDEAALTLRGGLAAEI